MKKFKILLMNNFGSIPFKDFKLEFKNFDFILFKSKFKFEAAKIQYHSYRLLNAIMPSVVLLNVVAPFKY